MLSFHLHTFPKGSRRHIWSLNKEKYMQNIKLFILNWGRDEKKISHWRMTAAQPSDNMGKMELLNWKVGECSGQLWRCICPKSKIWGILGCWVSLFYLLPRIISPLKMAYLVSVLAWGLFSFSFVSVQLFVQILLEVTHHFLGDGWRENIW